MKNNALSRNIQAAVVNHNTSVYAELMLRSLFARHSDRLDIAITVFDNQSSDDRKRLDAFASQMGVPILPSGLEITTKWNSHGEVLSAFAKAHPECDYLLFLDADVCFLQDDTLVSMLEEFKGNDNAFAVAPRLTSNAETEIPVEFWPLIYETRLHPCCALIRNTAIFQKVVWEIGLSCVQYLFARGEEYWDTFQLMTKVMKTHGFQVVRSSSMVQHFFSVSYQWDSAEMRQNKEALRNRLLEQYRSFEG